MKRLKFLAVLAFGAVAAIPASAYQVSPMIYDMKPTGQQATAVLRVENTNDKPITIELVAEKRSFDVDGKESRTPADADFVLFPPQAVIPAGATQAVRVQYVGPPTPTESVMYTVTVKQVPVELPASGPSGVQFVFNFSTLANIVPEGAKPRVEVVSLTPTDKGYALKVHNGGNRYANLALSRVTLTGAGYTRKIEGDEWRKSLGASWLLPGNDRIIALPAADGPSKAGLAATFELIESAK
jgi:fimbrial chaperone protein